METSEVLYKAADRIESVGWWDGGEDGASGPGTCAANAIYDTVGRDFGAAQAARSALQRHIGGADLSDIFDWNDAPGRTSSEVIEVLRAAALIESAKEQDAVWVTYAEVVSA